MSNALKSVLVFSVLAASSLVSAKAIVCVNKTGLVVPIRVTFTSTGATLKANDSTCQVTQVPYSNPQFPGWIKLAPTRGGCLSVGKVVTNSDLYAITLNPNAAVGLDGFAYVAAGPTTATPAHAVNATCFATPDPIN